MLVSDETDRVVFFIFPMEILSHVVLDQQKCLSVRMLAMEANISLQEAKGLMTQFSVKFGPRVLVRFVITGQSEDRNNVVCVAEQHNLDAVQGRLSRIISAEIYSIEPKLEIDSKHAAEALYLAHVEQMQRAVSQLDLSSLCSHALIRAENSASDTGLKQQSPLKPTKVESAIKKDEKVPQEKIEQKGEKDEMEVVEDEEESKPVSSLPSKRAASSSRGKATIKKAKPGKAQKASKSGTLGFKKQEQKLTPDTDNRLSAILKDDSDDSVEREPHHETDAVMIEPEPDPQPQIAQKESDSPVLPHPQDFDDRMDVDKREALAEHAGEKILKEIGPQDTEEPTRHPKIVTRKLVPHTTMDEKGYLGKLLPSIHLMC